MADISLKWGNVWGNCHTICFKQECNNCPLTDEFPWHYVSRILNNFYRYIISLKFENIQNSNLLCWIEDLLRKPQKPEWLCVIAIQQGKCLNVLYSLQLHYNTFFCGESHMTRQIWLALWQIFQQKCHSFPRRCLILAIQCMSATWD